MISESRQSVLARLIVDSVWDDDLVDYSDEDGAFRAAKRVLAQFVDEDERIDETVRAKIRSLKRNVIEGSMEWETLFAKYYQEETNRHG
ncbi:MAG: DUF507 domain-containing protein [Bdellovibrionales bacterium CG10_big_fil_rev_8_21_14_0_10_45_34]|nr:MAG: DUF507 domain-containing protein [Bdellovibrionales bacterium CG10_big_fil_rev_8_21_14_0_10_45_34]